MPVNRTVSRQAKYEEKRDDDGGMLLQEEKGKVHYSAKIPEEVSDPVLTNGMIQ